MVPRSAILSIGVLVLVAATAAVPAHAQTEPRYGASFQLVGSTADDNVGTGLRFRVSAPINRDVSFAVGSSITGFIFEGQDEADFAIDPQASLIVNVPQGGEEGLYFFGGAGAYVPLGDSPAESGPMFHFGGGKVWLLQESSLFLEFNPGLIIAEESTEVLFPIRVGVIF